MVDYQEHTEGSLKGWAIFSEDGDHRYALGREWFKNGPGVGRTILWVMLNPSRAGAKKNDRTIVRTMDFSRKWGYSAMIVVNLYGLITPQPEELLVRSDRIGDLNDRYIKQYAQESDFVMCGWGANAEPDRVRDVVAIFTALSMPLNMLELTKEGQPKHPLRLLGTLAPRRWRPNA